MNTVTNQLLDLLQSIDGYPFDPDKDTRFLASLISEFPEVDMQEQITRLSLWLSETHLPRRIHYRLLLRKWVLNASRRGE